MALKLCSPDSRVMRLHYSLLGRRCNRCTRHHGSHACLGSMIFRAQRSMVFPTMPLLGCLIGAARPYYKLNTLMNLSRISASSNCRLVLSPYTYSTPSRIVKSNQRRFLFGSSSSTAQSKAMASATKFYEFKPLDSKFVL